jgi:tRNA(Arg) A34 adenosine deaminase TadA
MQAAFDAARDALHAGEVPVGCCFEFDGVRLCRPSVVIGLFTDDTHAVWSRKHRFTGANRTNVMHNATMHAEMVAIRAVHDYCVLNGNSRMLCVSSLY